VGDVLGIAIRKKNKSQRGQSLVEFALVLPIFLLLVFAIIDFGFGFHAWLTVTNSAREGARIGAVRASETDIVQRVQDTADTLDQSRMTITVTNAQGNPGESVVVQVNYAYTMITPLDNILSLLSAGAIGPTLNFSSTADMRIE
jgi:Flp pilus assembly protein TadG